MELHTLKFEVDGAAATAGVKQFSLAIDKAIRSAESFDSRLTSAFARLATVSSKGFSTLARDIGKLGGVSINPNISLMMDKLSASVKGFKGPSAGAVANFSALSKSLSGFSVSASSAKNLSAITTALANFRAPSATSLSAIRMFLKEVASFKVPSSFRTFSTVLNAITASANRTAVSLRSLNSAAGSSNIAKLGANAGAASRSMMSLGSASNFADSALRAIGVVSVAAGFGYLISAVYGAEASMTKFRSTMIAATGSMAGVEKGLGFVRGLADELGVPLQQTGEKFAKFAIASDNAGVSMAESERIFRSMSIALTATGASAADADLAFLALEQMMSKGVVSAEELRRQLSERIPGAFGMMAEALGVTTAKLDKMLRLGQVMSADALPKLAEVMEKRFGRGLQQALDGPIVALNRLKNALFDLFLTFGQGGFMPALTEQMNNLAFAMGSPQVKQFISDMGYLAGLLVNVVGTSLQIVVDNIYLFANAAAILIGLKLQQYFSAFTLSLGASSTALAVNTVQVTSNAMANKVLGVTLVQTTTLTSRAATSFRGLATSVGSSATAMWTSLGPVGRFVALYTVFVQVARTVGLAVIDLGKHFGFFAKTTITAAQASDLLSMAISKGTLSQENAKRISDALSKALDEQRKKALQAVNAVSSYRSIWTGFLMRHKAELDATTKSLAELSKKFTSGAISASELKVSIAKVDMKGASSSAQKLAEDLNTVADESIALSGEQKELANHINTYRAAAIAAGKDTTVYDQLLQTLTNTTKLAAGEQDGLAKSIAKVGEAQKSIKQQIAESNNVYSTVPQYLRNIGNASTHTTQELLAMKSAASSSADSVDELTSSVNDLSNAPPPTIDFSQIENGVTRMKSLFDGFFSSVARTSTMTSSDPFSGFRSQVEALGGTFNSNSNTGVIDINVKDSRTGSTFTANETGGQFMWSVGVRFDEWLKKQNSIAAAMDKKANEASSTFDTTPISNLNNTMAGLAGALNTNSAAITGLNSGLSTSLGLIFNRLDLARRNVSGLNSDPNALFNAGAGSFRDINGFATGGEFTVGGRGGTDKNFVPLRLTRGENVRITPKGQESGGGVVIQGITINATDYDSFRRNKAGMARELAAAVKLATNSGRTN